MAKRKWYVVTVGKDIGVFPTWLEAGPLVKGVPEAIHQSFWSEEEANQKFSQELAKGNTRIIGTNGQENHSPRETAISMSHSKTERSNLPPGSVASSIVIDFNSRLQNKATHASPSYATSYIPEASPSRASRTPQNSSHSPPSNSSSPMAWSSSDASSRMRRFDVINALFKKEGASVGVEAQASQSGHASASTPTSELATPLHHSTNEDESRPQVVVKTPSWLAAYPKVSPSSLSSPLSPLNHADLPLNHFMDLSNETVFISRHAGTTGTGAPNTSKSPVHMSPTMGPPNDTYQGDMDPRSPFTQSSHIPELTFFSPLLFSRPSPSTARKELPRVPSRNSPIKSSLLLRPNEATSE